MTGLTLIEGDERARKCLEEGKTIVDFLTDPFMPCAVFTQKRKELIAVNNGNATNADRFRSLFQAVMENPMSAVYSVEYMADDKLILTFQRSHMPPPKNADSVLCQRGAAKLSYDRSELIIEGEFRERGYSVVDVSPRMFSELCEQREKNLAARADELAEFYGGLRKS